MPNITTPNEFAEAIRDFTSTHQANNNTIEQLGLTENGRIVRLVDTKPEEQKKLNTTFITHMSLLDQSISWDNNTTIDTINKKLIDRQVSKIPPQEGINTTLSQTTSKNIQPLEIIHQMKTVKYKKQFKDIELYLNSDITEGKDISSPTYVTTYTKQECKKEIGTSFFGNYFTQDSWVCSYNDKSRMKKPNLFFMSNVIAHQLEKLSEKTKQPLQLPKTIIRENIDNEETLKVIQKHEGHYDSEAFKKDFLENTVNGKSTIRITEEFGLKVNNLSVQSKPSSYDNETIHISVVVQVSPANT